MTSRENIADALSRLTKIPASKGHVQDEEYVRKVTLHAVPVVLRIEEIEEVSFQDEEWEAVREALETVHWSKAPKAYELVSHELACIGQVVQRGTRIVVPRKLIRRVLDLAHEGRQGIVKTKQRLKSKVWWPGSDKEAEKKCIECFGCQIVSRQVPPPPIKPTRLPERVWQLIGLDPYLLENTYLWWSIIS